MAFIFKVIGWLGPNFHVTFTYGLPPLPCLVHWLFLLSKPRLLDTGPAEAKKVVCMNETSHMGRGGLLPTGRWQLVPDRPVVALWGGGPLLPGVPILQWSWRSRPMWIFQIFKILPIYLWLKLSFCFASLTILWLRPSVVYQALIFQPLLQILFLHTATSSFSASCLSHLVVRT